MSLTPICRDAGGVGAVFPVKIDSSALLESGYSSTGAVATNCTITLGFKPTAATTTPLTDMSGHYLLTIQKVGGTVRVWKQGVELTNYTGSVGATYAEFLSNVLTAYSGSNKGYYSRLVIVEAVKAYSDFWEPSDLVTGLWGPKKLSGLTLNTHLDFSDANNLGKDVSGNGNHWTVAGAPVQTIDTPTNNHATLNPLSPSKSGLFANGNLRGYNVINSGIYEKWTSTFRMETGKWWCRFSLTRTGSAASGFGLTFVEEDGHPYKACYTCAFWMLYTGEYKFYNSNFVTHPVTNYLDVADNVDVLIDMDGGTLTLVLDNVVQPPIDISSITSKPLLVFAGDARNAATGISTFDFDFGATGTTPPVGCEEYLSKCAENHLDPTILKSSTVADLATRVGTGAATSVVLPDMEGGPDIVNIKPLGDAYDWYLFDTKRVGFELNTNTTDASASNNWITSFNEDGYTFKDGFSFINALDSNFIDLCLIAGVDQGFAIKQVSHTNGTPTVFDHGLGKPVTFAIAKQIDGVGGWTVFHQALGGDKFVLFDTQAAQNWTGIWPTNTGTQFAMGGVFLTGTFIVYLFTDSEIFRAFSYTGNNSADGPFVNLGGKPLWFMAKNTTGGNWFALDSARESVNPVDEVLYPNLPNASGVEGFNNFTSTGVKVKNNLSFMNGSDNLHIGLAILESTKYSNAF